MRSDVSFDQSAQSRGQAQFTTSRVHLPNIATFFQDNVFFVWLCMILHGGKTGFYPRIEIIQFGVWEISSSPIQHRGMLLFLVKNWVTAPCTFVQYGLNTIKQRCHLKRDILMLNKLEALMRWLHHLLMPWFQHNLSNPDVTVIAGGGA